jgi:hypothetical protein
MNTRKREIPSLEGEVWKDIKGFESIYSISNFGRVYLHGRYVFAGKKIGKRWQPPQFMTPQVNQSGYLNLFLRDNGKIERKYIHRLVAEHFIPNIYNYPCVDHKDTNTKNNHVSNLRFCTHKMNSNNPNTLNKMSKSHKKRVFEKRMRHSSVVGININDYNDVRTYFSMTDAKNDGFNPNGISKCCLKRINQHHGFKWMYLNEYETLINKSKNKSSNAEI